MCVCVDTYVIIIEGVCVIFHAVRLREGLRRRQVRSELGGGTVQVNANNMSSGAYTQHDLGTRCVLLPVRCNGGGTS